MASSTRTSSARASAISSSDDDVERTTRSTVCVACKMPHGIIIRDHQEASVNEPVMGGGTRAVPVFRPVGAKIFIKGNLRRETDVVAGYAITENVDAGVFARWMEWNKDSAIVRNGMIYGDAKRSNVEAWARERGSTKSGLEPIDVRMVRKDDRMALADERVHRVGAGAVVDGNVKVDGV